MIDNKGWCAVHVERDIADHADDFERRPSACGNALADNGSGDIPGKAARAKFALTTARAGASV
jgi:hypothetical protein